MPKPTVKAHGKNSKHSKHSTHVRNIHEWRNQIWRNDVVSVILCLYLGFPLEMRRIKHPLRQQSLRWKSTLMMWCCRLFNSEHQQQQQRMLWTKKSIKCKSHVFFSYLGQVFLFFLIKKRSSVIVVFFPFEMNDAQNVVCASSKCFIQS